MSDAARELAQRAVHEWEAAQDPEELEAVIGWLEGFTPRVVLEIGVYRGGTMALWRHLWPNAELWGIDIAEPRCEGCLYHKAHSNCPHVRIRNTRARIIRADSTDPDTYRHIQPDLFDFVYYDGLHTWEAVHAEYEIVNDLYKPLASQVSRQLFHDTWAYDGPARLVEFLKIRAHETGAFRVREIINTIGSALMEPMPMGRIPPPGPARWGSD